MQLRKCSGDVGESGARVARFFVDLVVFLKFSLLQYKTTTNSPVLYNHFDTKN